jgi:hypothetical protein
MRYTFFLFSFSFQGHSLPLPYLLSLPPSPPNPHPSSLLDKSLPLLLDEAVNTHYLIQLEYNPDTNFLANPSIYCRYIISLSKYKPGGPTKLIGLTIELYIFSLTTYPKNVKNTPKSFLAPF